MFCRQFSSFSLKHLKIGLLTITIRYSTARHLFSISIYKTPGDCFAEENINTCYLRDSQKQLHGSFQLGSPTVRCFFCHRYHYDNGVIDEISDGTQAALGRHSGGTQLPECRLGAIGYLFYDQLRE